MPHGNFELGRQLLLKIADFTMFYACMLWLMYCGKKLEFEIELKFMLYVLYILKL